MGIASPPAILNLKTYATFEGGRCLQSLPKLCLGLLSEQKKVWDDLREGCESLKHVKERDLSCREFTVRLQHNPRRMKSSLAGVAEKNMADPIDFFLPLQPGCSSSFWDYAEDGWRTLGRINPAPLHPLMIRSLLEDLARPFAAQIGAQDRVREDS